MVRMVSLYHPTLERWHDVPVAAVEGWKKRGWLTEKPEKPAAEEPGGEALPASDPTPSFDAVGVEKKNDDSRPAGRRRRASENEESADGNA